MQYPLVRVCRQATRKTQRGFIALLDLVVGVAVIVGLIAAVLAIASLATGGSDGLKAEQEMLGLRVGTVTAFSTQPNYGTADITTFLANSTDVPDTLKRSGTGPITLTNKWGGAVSVVGATASFNINYAGLPKNMCNKILPRLKASDWSAVSVGSTAITLPVTPIAADAACAATNALVLSAI